MERLFGLIGYKLGHSFSKKYFTEKFEKENIEDARYELFELSTIEELDDLIKHYPDLKGLNVTIPYKQQVIPFLDTLDESAEKVGAVNVIKLTEDRRIGYNSDYYGFKNDLVNWMGNGNNVQALVLGTGGASKAVKAALDDLGIPHIMVSRKKGEGIYTYDEVKEKDLLTSHQLIINTTPLGMAPETDQCPDINYEQLNNHHWCYDLVYNPEHTTFMEKCSNRGAQVKNGLGMLYLQAEKAWEIWNG